MSDINESPDSAFEDEEELPITVGDWHELQVGDDIIVNGVPKRIYTKSLVHALPGETDIDHITRAEAIVLNAYLFHATQTRAFMESLAAQRKGNNK